MACRIGGEWSNRSSKEEEIKYKKDYAFPLYQHCFVRVMIVLVFVFMMVVVVMMLLVVVDFFFISYIHKSSVHLKQCCNMTFDKKATNSQNRLLLSAFKSLHCQKAFWVHVVSRALMRGSVVFRSLQLFSELCIDFECPSSLIRRVSSGQSLKCRFLILA